MKINLVEAEIQAALIEFISNQGIDVSHKEISVTLIAGRGANGHSAQIEIVPREQSEKDEATYATETQAVPFDFSTDLVE